jgi:tripartite-type tricarboxylate transporter receptor subunit TctC
LGITGLARGQDYPNRTIRIVTSASGGGTDFVARVVSQGLTGSLGQQVIVDNRGGNIPVEIVSQAPPDGYTLLADGSSFWVTPLLQKAPYDPVRDFSPITLVVSAPNLLVVHPSLPVKSVKELIALAKAKPGELNFSSGGVGGGAHLSGELFKSMAGVNMVHIPYKGGGPAMIALLGGEVQLLFPNTPSAAPYMKSGKLRALAVTSAQPSVLFPALPTVSASGLPGYESGTTYGIFAPAKTAAALINRLNQEIVRVLNRTDVKEQFLNAGVEVVGSSPEQFAATMKIEMVKWGKLIKDAGIKVE